MARAPSATADIGGVPRGAFPPAAATSGRAMRLARWLGVAFAALQFTLYTPAPGMPLPFPRPLGVAVVAPVALLNLIDLRWGARLLDAYPWAWPTLQLGVDGACVLGMLWLFAFDTSNALWALLVLPVLQAALRSQLRGALITWAVLSVGYVARDVWAAATYPHVVLYPDSITFRLGIVGIVATATGSLAGRLTATAARLAAQVRAYQQALAEVDGLRQVAAATHRITSLDADTVVHEVAVAAARIGFGPVRMCRRDGDDQWTVVRADSGGTERGRGRRVDPDGPGVRARGDQPGSPAARARCRSARGVAFRGGGPGARRCRGGRGPGRRARGRGAPTRRGGPRAARRAGRGGAGQRPPVPGAPAVRGAAEPAGAARRADRAAEPGAAPRPPQSCPRRVGPVRGAAGRDAARLGPVQGDQRHARPQLRGRSARPGGAAAVGHGPRRGQRVPARRRRVNALIAVDVADEQDARHVATRVLAALHEPYVVDGLTLDVEASIGIALAPRHGTDVDALLRCADVAMYPAKTRRLGISVYDPSQDEHTPDRLALLGDLRRALEVDDQLVLHYQPQVDVALGELVGVEALARWQHPTRGLIPPVEFIPVADGTGLIHKLTTYVLGQALAHARAWADAGHPLPVAVNVSTRCLLDVGLPDQIDALLARHGVPPHLLRLEITEGTIMSDPTRALAVLQRLSDRGIRLSVDDFGTGYSSMSYLKRLPVDELKVDRSFVLDMGSETSDAVLVRSVVEIGHNLGLAVVAEGVEDAATLAALVEVGCDVAQGYDLGRPMPAADLSDWLAAHTPDLILD